MYSPYKKFDSFLFEEGYLIVIVKMRFICDELM